MYNASMAMADPSWKAFLERIEHAESREELLRIEHELFGRKSGVMTLKMKELQAISPEERPKYAKELNTWKQKLSQALEEAAARLTIPADTVLASHDTLDVTLDLPERERGHLHPIQEFLRHVEEVFGRMGFDVATGPEVETEELNFTMLNIPESHPARDAQDTFWIKSAKKGKDRLVLRTHTSPVQIRYMRTHKPPFRAIFPGKVYRKDADATHSPMFHQFEGFMVGKDITLANMKAVMIAAITQLIPGEVEFRFRTGYFPFVEPGLELDVRWQGEDKTKEGDWLEIVGCGMVHPTVLRNGGLDPEEWQGFAFGFGADRMAMIRHQIPDIRSLFPGDVRFLRQF